VERPRAADLVQVSDFMGLDASVETFNWHDFVLLNFLVKSTFGHWLILVRVSFGILFQVLYPRHIVVLGHYFEQFFGSQTWICNDPHCEVLALNKAVGLVKTSQSGNFSVDL